MKLFCWLILSGYFFSFATEAPPRATVTQPERGPGINSIPIEDPTSMETLDDLQPNGPETDALFPAWEVERMTVIKEYGKSVDWLSVDNLIASARPLYDGYYDVIIFSMDRPEEEIWLTHDAYGPPQKHNGNPCWHPSGEFLVYTAENEDVPVEYDQIAKPGRGVNCNLWLARADGSYFFQLTDYQTSFWDAKAVIHPQFSSDGNRVFWAERIADDSDTYWGKWVIKISDFVNEAHESPRLENIQTCDPGNLPCFYESHAFSHDGDSILFSGNLLNGQHETGLDIYAMNMKTRQLTQLTESVTDWDEHAHWSPDGAHIVWMSSAGLDVVFPDDMGPLDWRHYLATELWIMNADGTNKQRLTFFNDPLHMHHQATRTIVSDSAWAPDGKGLIVLVAHSNDSGPFSSNRAELVHITLATRTARE